VVRNDRAMSKRTVPEIETSIRSAADRRFETSIRDLPSTIRYLPSTGFLRLKRVLEFIPVSPTEWWRGVHAGRLPKPIKLGPRMSAWRAEDIKALIDRLNAKEGK
jgi:prophage regulatory protein